MANQIKSLNESAAIELRITTLEKEISDKDNLISKLRAEVRELREKAMIVEGAWESAMSLAMDKLLDKI